MAPSAQAHRRSHSLLLLQKLLNLRDSASPLTLVLDSLEQTAGPVVKEITSRAKIGRTKVIFLSFATARVPAGADAAVTGWGRDLAAVRTELHSHYPSPQGSSEKESASRRAVVIIDSLNELATQAPQFVTAFLSTIITPAVSVVAVYHTDIPLPRARGLNPYEPDHLTVLCHLATAILRLYNLPHEIERHNARNRSVAEPEFGLREGIEGVVVGLRGKADSETRKGAVLEMELRKKSGRAITEKFVLLPPPAKPSGDSEPLVPSKLMLLADHPAFSPPRDSEPSQGAEDGEVPESTFDLGLTEKQRRDRDGVVLPYFDAQTDIGSGEGGRILYDMGREDDFDDEEDEI